MYSRLNYVTMCTRDTVKEGGLGQYDLGINGGGEDTWKMSVMRSIQGSAKICTSHEEQNW